MSEGSEHRAATDKDGDIADILLAYEAWEADLILNSDWPDGVPALTAEQWERAVFLQAARNNALEVNGPYDASKRFDLEGFRARCDLENEA